MHAPPWSVLPVIVLVILATRADVRTRKIPNRLTGPAFLLALATYWALGGPRAAGMAVVGGLVAGLVLLPGWLMGFMGAGDVKLMAAVGAWLGFPDGLLAALAALVAGGVIAVIVAARQGRLMQAFRNALGLGRFLLGRMGGPAGTAPVFTGVRFPFAPAVLLGALFALLRRG